ncbi:MAG: nucleotidyltransferase family protein [Rikenellaceae bacterium]|nr:nucleotidyltransferase family protein [Rikenellaceae bacterium]
MYLTPEHQIFFQSLNIALWPQVQSDSKLIETEDINPETLFNLALSQGVMALTLDGLKLDLKSLDKELWLRWNMSVKKVENRRARQCAVLRELVTLFRSHGIELMVLKGIGASMLYPRPDHRECGDIDIYLMGDYERGNDIIKALGIEVDTKSCKHSNFFFKGVPIENHKTFLNVNGSSIDRNLDRELCRILKEQGTDTIMLEDIPVRIPTPDFQAIFLTRHAIVHFLGLGLVCRYICDLALFFSSMGERINAPRFEKVMRDEGQYLLLCSFLSIGGKYLRMPHIDCPDTSFDTQKVEELAEKVLKEAFNNSSRSISKEERLKMWVVRRKLIGIKQYALSKWKYDSIRRGLFRSELFYRLAQNLHISNWR